MRAGPHISVLALTQIAHFTSLGKIRLLDVIAWMVPKRSTPNSSYLIMAHVHPALSAFLPVAYTKNIDRDICRLLPVATQVPRSDVCNAMLLSTESTPRRNPAWVCQADAMHGYVPPNRISSFTVSTSPEATMVPAQIEVSGGWVADCRWLEGLCYLAEIHEDKDAKG